MYGAVFMLCILLQTSTFTSSKMLESQYSFNCFDQKDQSGSNGNYSDNTQIGLQVSDRTTHQLITRIFAIFLREKIKFKNIKIVKMHKDTNHSVGKFNKTDKIIESIVKDQDLYMINLEVWTAAYADFILNTTVFEAGNSIIPGYFGWFARKSLYNATTLCFEIFLNPSSDLYKTFIIKENHLNKLKSSPEVEYFLNPQCSNLTCVTILAEYKADTDFAIEHIERTKAFVNILWLGSSFKTQLSVLHIDYINETHKSFIIIHWFPSDVMFDKHDYAEIYMPRCNQSEESEKYQCKYESTPILKYYNADLEYKPKLAYALRRFKLNHEELKELMKSFNNNTSSSYDKRDEQYNTIACKWLQDNENKSNDWDVAQERERKLLIGLVLPNKKLEAAVNYAIAAVKKSSILNNYTLEVLIFQDKCEADMALKAIVQFFNNGGNLLGVLGPACSETVVPIAGITRHMGMIVISYSAEGGTFVDRRTYPYFFRTIGSNRQYGDVYIEIMRRLGWRQVAALSEDGQKYTEYISHMEPALKQHNLELLINKKFLSDVNATEMNKCLLDLKKRHARIIIADIHNKNVFLALCEAQKLEMTAQHGYVWFLPSWIAEDWDLFKNLNGPCREEQLKEALNGHFTLQHTPYGNPNATMQENITVTQWRKKYEDAGNATSNYIGFAYDAVWTYATAADKLFNENQEAYDYLNEFATINRLKELIWETDIKGLSGRVKFGIGGSRITDIDIMQWNNTNYTKVGTFKPEIIGEGPNIHPKGGNLSLNEAMILWLGGKNPGDGCKYAPLARILKKNCDSAEFLFIALICIIIVLTVSVISFMFWKRRFDKKMKGAAKVMKNFGIDLMSSSRCKLNTLDKWEIPKENVVTNRRLGEGAFGTVYGGEAQIGIGDWAAVAVKTLKAGASTEDRLDFLSEAEAMKRFNHKNIVKLLGVCLQSEPIYTIMEYMLYGDLKTFLLARRQLVNENLNDDADTSPKRLTMYAMDIARGLAYLSSQKYVHRDVACRNCLVNAHRVVKLGDFGMARPTFDQDYYRFNRKGMLPVRWMAPEALALGIFTPASDVWSFGVVVFEIITFGSFPFQGLTNNQVLEHVKKGNTLKIPSGVKPQLEGLINACWSQEPKKRPTAKEVAEYICKYPRLLVPCLDYPGASIEMPETESDENEMLLQLSRQDTTPDGYSHMQPLLMNHIEETENSATMGRTFAILQTPF